MNPKRLVFGNGTPMPKWGESHTPPDAWLRLLELDRDKYYSQRAIWIHVESRSLDALAAKLQTWKVPWIIHSSAPGVRLYQGKYLHKIAPIWASIKRGKPKYE
jgi:hypothetical protein